MLHLHSAYGLTRHQQEGPRPQSYQSKRDYVAADFASRTMRWTGIIVLLFLIFHLMDLTWGNANAQFVRGDPYNNLVYSLQRPAVAIVYIVANIALGVPPVPRRLVDVPEHGHQQPARSTSCAGAFATGLRRASSSSATSASRSWCRRTS